MNIQSLLNGAQKKLISSSIISAKLDSEILLSEVIKKNRKYLILNSNKVIEKNNIKIFNCLVNRREKNEPIAYLINKKEFWKQNFYVDKNVLIPRPDTEILVEETLKLTDKSSSLNILDIGTGSGCILLSILKELNSSRGTGIDISSQAIKMAKINSEKLNFLVPQTRLCSIFLKHRVRTGSSKTYKYHKGLYDSWNF